MTKRIGMLKVDSIPNGAQNNCHETVSRHDDHIKEILTGHIISLKDKTHFLTRQRLVLAGHCPLTSPYFEAHPNTPALVLIKYLTPLTCEHLNFQLRLLLCICSICQTILYSLE